MIGVSHARTWSEINGSNEIGRRPDTTKNRIEEWAVTAATCVGISNIKLLIATTLFNGLIWPDSRYNCTHDTSSASQLEKPYRARCPQKLFFARYFRANQMETTYANLGVVGTEAVLYVVCPDIDEGVHGGSLSQVKVRSGF